MNKTKKYSKEAQKIINYILMGDILFEYSEIIRLNNMTKRKIPCLKIK